MAVLGDTNGLFDEEEALHLPAQAASVSHRVAFGPHAGQPVHRLRAGAYPWPSEENLEVSSAACVAMGGYSVHAATAVKAREREKLERLVRYSGLLASRSEHYKKRPETPTQESVSVCPICKNPMRLVQIVCDSRTISLTLEAPSHARAGETLTSGDAFGYSRVLCGALDAMVDPVAAPYDVAAVQILFEETSGLAC